MLGEQEECSAEARRIRVHGCTTAVKASGDLGFGETHLKVGQQCSCLLGRQFRGPPALILPLGLGQRDAFALALADERPFKFGKGAHEREE